MAKNRQHQWEPVPDTDLVKCVKCGTEVTATKARSGAGPCKWGEPDKTPPVLNPEEETEQERIMHTLNLCATCFHNFGECGSDPKFGTSPGNDNVYECDAYTEGEKPAFSAPVSPTINEIEAEHDINYSPEPPKHPGPRLTDPPEYCNACGVHIAILPLNSKIDMVACNNHRCALYRERLRTVTKPVERGKRKSAKG